MFFEGFFLGWQEGGAKRAAWLSASDVIQRRPGEGPVEVDRDVQGKGKIKSLTITSQERYLLFSGFQ